MSAKMDAIVVSASARPSSDDRLRTCDAGTLPPFPGSVIYFQTADIVSEVLNFGLPAPIDVQIRT